MTTTTAKYSPERVSQMSDAELSEAVARAGLLGLPLVDFRVWVGDRPHACVLRGDARNPGLYLLCGTARDDVTTVEPSNPLAYHAVLEHMRQRWAEIAKAGCDDSLLRFWEIASDAGGWSVSVRDYDDRIVAQSFHDDASPSLGGQIFECALLAMQEMP